MTDEPRLPLSSGSETLIVYRRPCDYLRRCEDEDVHERVHIDGHCSEARAPGPLPEHEVRYGDWTESNCTPCRIAYRVVNFGETVEPVHKPGGAS